MALDAFPVVGIEVQPGERIGLVASGATWRLGDPAGAVRAVALGAAAIDPGVRSLFCGLVAASATPRGRLARVWFVARRALLVSAGGALVFFGVAAVAALLYARAVGIVTALTAGVPPIDLSRLPLVAGLAGLRVHLFAGQHALRTDRCGDLNCSDRGDAREHRGVVANPDLDLG